MKKSQVSQSVFYIFGIVVIGLLLTAGLHYLSKTSEQHRQLLLTQFSQQIQVDVASLTSQYGYVQTFTYDLPDSYGKLCFLDLSQRQRLLQSPSLTDYPLLLDAAQTDSTNNVFLLGEDVQSYSVNNLTLPTYPYYDCRALSQGQIQLTFEGAGRKTLLLTNLTTTAQLDPYKEIHLFSVDGQIEIILPEGTTARIGSNPVTSISIQVVKPESVTSDDITSELYKFSPDGTQFDQPVLLKMRYFPEVLGNPCPERLVYHTFHDDGTPKRDYDSQSIDCQNQMVTFSITGFSIGGQGNGTGNQTLCDLSCLFFSPCSPTGTQSRLCGNPDSCNLLLLTPKELLLGLCGSGPVNCFDTDNGFDVSIKGSCTDTRPTPTSDRCFNTTHIIESGCGNPNSCETRTLSCPAGTACLRGACDVLTTCSDARKNGDESDVDCGGTKCDPCAIGKKCIFNVDCQSNLCQNGICQPSCTDMIKDQDETDVDCGGSCPAKCSDGKRCGINIDCQSSRCDLSTKKCISCTDGIKNQDESDVDCGGTICSPCSGGKRCQVMSDCTSNVCMPPTHLCKSSLPKGWHDGSDCTASGGWACDADDYPLPIMIHFYKDGPAGSGTFIGVTRADIAREPAVAAECGGNPNHGFYFPTPSSVKDGQPHTIYVHAINVPDPNNNPLLSGTPKMIWCS